MKGRVDDGVGAAEVSVAVDIEIWVCSGRAQVRVVIATALTVKPGNEGNTEATTLQEYQHLPIVVLGVVQVAVVHSRAAVVANSQGIVFE